MGKTIKLTESELINIIKKIVYNRPVISEVDKNKDYNEDFPKYNYSSIGVLPNNKNSNEIGVVFFNGVVFGKSDYRKPEQPKMILFKGPMGDFKFDSIVVKQTKDGAPFVTGLDLNKEQYNKLLPLIVVEPAPQKTSNSLLNKDNNNFTGKEITSALRMTYPENWVKATDDYSAGLKGIHTIGEKMGTDIDWSIMNFFHSKDTVKKLIDEKWNSEGSGNKIEWLSWVFQNDKKFLNNLLKIQWNSIKSGYENESMALKNYTDLLTKYNVEFEYEVYPPGHKKDRYGSIDLTLKIKDKAPLTIQIKPLDDTQELPNGDIKVYTKGMKDDYKSEEGLGFILYNKGKNFFMFRNKNYYVIPSSEGKEVIHKDKPFRVY